ncbi:segregation/condensation protein A [Plantactinospora sp. CA-294935]|uniref:segregation and condensation protein A n=1 Tax=Plantactinospora sp. CA-294935 TaxID=3240012 RepID=UPI003D8F293D
MSDGTGATLMADGPEPVDYGRRVSSPPTSPAAPDPRPPASDPPLPSPDSLPAGTVGADEPPIAADRDALTATGQDAVPVDPTVDPAHAEAEAAAAGGFTVRLANFTGPFDLLLQLIGKHKLDVTEVALHRVTDEFIAYIRAMGDDWDLDEASEFLVVAATLLDLKAARLLPAAQVEDEEDLALLEARDLLFARLLQYKAFKEASGHIAELEAVGSRRYPRAVALEPRYAEALPDLVLGIGADRLAALAVRAMTPKKAPVVSIDHVHMVRVSVREHAALLRDRLRRAGIATFRVLCADCESTLEVVARFLALLELYREGLVGFAQVEALGELTVRWTGPEDGGAELDIDEYAGAPAPPEPSAGGAEPAVPAESGTGPGGTEPDGAESDRTESDGTESDGTATGDETQEETR